MLIIRADTNNRRHNGSLGLRHRYSCWVSKFLSIYSLLSNDNSKIYFSILLASLSFVLQTSRVSAIRGNLSGGIANSTVRRHPIQHRFLQSAGQQTHVMKLAGYLFFGTIVGVESKVRSMLQDQFQSRPIRFLVLDLYNVDGVDFSAAEAFTRINRILKAKGVELVICGVRMDGGT